jgi:hypothetical protein
VSLFIGLTWRSKAGKAASEVTQEGDQGWLEALEDQLQFCSLFLLW